MVTWSRLTRDPRQCAPRAETRAQWCPDCKVSVWFEGTCTRCLRHIHIYTVSLASPDILYESCLPERTVLRGCSVRSLVIIRIRTVRQYSRVTVLIYLKNELAQLQSEQRTLTVKPADV